jgi:hypothetical protein
MNVANIAVCVTGSVTTLSYVTKNYFFKLLKVSLTLVTRGRVKVKFNQIENAIMAQKMHKKKIFHFKILFFSFRSQSNKTFYDPNLQTFVIS